MDERAGSYVIGADGMLTPNTADEAMAERHGLKPELPTGAKANQQDTTDDVRNKKNSKKGVNSDVRE